MAHQKAVQIHIGSFPTEHRVEIEGKDVTHLIRGIEICAGPHATPDVRITFVGYNVQTEVTGKINLEVKQLITSIEAQTKLPEPQKPRPNAGDWMNSGD